MKKENVLFGAIGLMVGMIVGFMFANSVNQQSSAQVTGTGTEMRANSNMPPGHPDIGGASGGTQGGMQPETQAAIDKAKSSPDDFDAQLKAAEMYYQIGRFDEAIGYLTKANKLKPDDRQVMIYLGNAHFDADKYAEAEKWYQAALSKEDDVSVRTDMGLTFVFRDPPNYDRAIQEFKRSLSKDPAHIQTLQNLTVAYTKKNDAAGAKETLAKLESVDPSNASLQRLRDEVAKLP